MDFLGYTQPLHMERLDGWHKYVTDSHNSYAQARSSRNHIWATTNAQDAFVTAQLEGQRITVQEALLLTNQTWIPEHHGDQNDRLEFLRPRLQRLPRA